MGLKNKVIRFLTKSASWLATIALTTVGFHIGGSWVALSNLGAVDWVAMAGAFAGIVKNLHDLWVEIPEEAGTKAESMPTSAYLKTW